MKSALPLALVLAAACAPPSLAHHSTAMFDFTKSMTLTGTIKELQWTNPHAWVQVIADGKEYSLECGSPNTMSRQGWKRNTVKPGDPVTVMMRPMKDGTPAGMLVSILLKDGRTLGAGVTPGPPPPIAAAPK